MMSNLPQDAVGVIDRGFAGLNFMQELVQTEYVNFCNDIQHF